MSSYRIISTNICIQYFILSVGDLRFAAPQSPETLEGIQDATSYGPACPQSLTVLGNLSISGLFSNDTDTSEDCK